MLESLLKIYETLVKIKGSLQAILYYIHSRVTKSFTICLHTIAIVCVI